jgi:hypothetical protein
VGDEFIKIFQHALENIVYPLISDPCANLKVAIRIKVKWDNISKPLIRLPHDIGILGIGRSFNECNKRGTYHTGIHVVAACVSHLLPQLFDRLIAILPANEFHRRVQGPIIQTELIVLKGK